ncbi:hypothetical protein [Geomesophilobacter sediminis]|uniref:WD40 repeat domain-containing protein n=1 Tax=Geomesophilobacter sediminis TaxID=2798584 RepID=A0A8J7S9K5_9BACT|nr:hypothetical protein [Geomesophilobacter sediminis]MBJ6726880.1 hypothetical protein [Geomesophilobacter sediminis]
MIRVHRLAVLLALTVSVFSGCATLPYSAPLPKELTIKKIGKVDPGAPFAVSQNGTVATVSGGAVQTITSGTETPQQVADLQATALSFSPSGEQLAVAGGKENVLRIYGPQGKLLGETKVRGRVTALIWRSEKEVLAAAMHVQRYSFGSELVTLLHRWNGAGAPATATLSDTTIKKSTAAWPDDVLYGTFALALSPYGDEIAYRFLRDPPLFPPYQSLVLRHLESGQQHELTSIPVSSAGPFFAADGERVVVGDAMATHWFGVPEGKEQLVIPAPGSSLSASSSGAYLLMNGQLYRGEQKIASFAPDSVGAFLPDGTGLVLGYHGALYLVSGLTDTPPPAPAKDREKLLKLRRLRSLELITNEEFKKELARVPAK